MKFLKSLIQKFTGKPVDWDELEESLIRADLGVPMTMRIIDARQERARTTSLTAAGLAARARHTAMTAADIAEVARKEISQILPTAPLPIRPLPAKPKVILIVGVN